MNLSIPEIQRRIYLMRGFQVVLDQDLADLYETKTKALNQAVRRNSERFPLDFMFQITAEEQADLFKKKQRKSEGRGGSRSLPYAFTQEGVSMLSFVLNTPRAVEVSILIMRAFVQLTQISRSHLDFVSRLNEFEVERGEQYRAILAALQKREGFSQGPATFSSALSFPVNVIVPSVNPQQRHPVNDPLVAKSDQNKISAIYEVVTKYFGLKASDMKLRSRRKSVALPRQIAIYLVRKRVGMSLKDIGIYFGGRDHTTILSACEKISIAVENNQVIREKTQDIENLCRFDLG